MDNKFIRAGEVAQELSVSKPYRRCLNQDVVVQGNPRVYKALKLELDSVLTELKRIEAGNSVDEELMNVIELISIILGGLKGEDENGK